MVSAASPPERRSEPDIMNDPAFETNAPGREKGSEEPDTCRICRGEGTREEPLFYPCKCSGSIKFVHQGCLMEWLSHSQKKHCELCKTSFRFTKLYDPLMPVSVPLGIFFRQATLHVFRSLLTWSRWNLVALVWLGWVPWCMRTVWRGLFWLGDGSWITKDEIDRHSAYILGRAAQEQPGGLVSASASAASSSQTFSGPALSWAPISQTLNFSAGEPTMLWLGKRIFRGLFSQPSPASLISSPSNGSTVLSTLRRSPSMLSDINFLKTLTRWNAVNNLVLDVLEGQLITLFVVVSFILVFLIREWVVQQQPAINFGPAINADDAAPVAQNGAPDFELHNDPIENDQHEVDGNLPENGTVHRADGEGEADVRPEGSVPKSTLHTVHREDSPPDDGHANEHHSAPTTPAGHLHRKDEATGSLLSIPSHQRSRSVGGAQSSEHRTFRPGMRSRDALARASEIQRILEEQSLATGQDGPGVEVLMDIWKRSDRNPDEVLQLIEREGRSEELRWVVAAMNKLKSISANDKNDHPIGETSDSSGEQHSEDSNGSWQVVDTSSKGENDSTSAELNLEGTVSELDDTSRDALQNSGNPQEPDDPQLLESDDPEPDALPDAVKVRPEESSSSLSNESIVQISLGTEESQADGSRIVPDVLQDAPSNADADNLSVSTMGLTPPANEDIIIEAADSSQPIPSLPAQEGENPNITDHPQESQSEGSQQDGRPRGLWDRTKEWLWGDVPETDVPVEEPDEGDDEQVVENVEEEEPFVPVARGQLMIEDGNDAAPLPRNDPEVLQAALDAGVDDNDAEAIEDGEDLEGVMELIGMQGPLAGLVQNGMFSAVLISMSLFFGIWVPYIAGKWLLVFLSNPVSLLFKIPLRWLSTLVDVVVDSCIFVAGCAFYWLDAFIRLSSIPLAIFVPIVQKAHENQLVPKYASNFTRNAAKRLTSTFNGASPRFSNLEIPVFSILAHESMKDFEGYVINATTSLSRGIQKFLESPMNRTAALEQSVHILESNRLRMQGLYDALKNGSRHASLSASDLLKAMAFRINLEIPPRTTPLDYSLVHWSTTDRIIVVILGYLLFYAAGAVYLKIRNSLQAISEENERRNGVFVDILNQAGGVMKVILIISIEMIIFPLYCGLLLDVALLPLFENATLVSRIRFTAASPATSLFVHWFVGTCYMFHFALFVSMCRKIMRSGVLYFIRDPDDPTFHPVRDVLERNVYTQLRKIAFSALVYGALVIVCLGTVIWGIAAAFNGVFPIHWSSNEPVLEFPVDLLVYNFLMPVAVRFLKPSTGLSKMYEWWFRKCARFLRLTHFLFDERRIDEEGYRKSRSTATELTGEEAKDLGMPEHYDTSEFVHDGRYVRAPASDQVRIPKGARTFVEVDVNGNRLDGLPDVDHGLHGRQNKMFAQVYIPPHFRLRIAAFVVLLWLFAATTGVSLTVLPLLFGRYVFTFLIPDHRRMNDMYAFAIGIYVLGGPIFLAIRHHAALRSIANQFPRSEAFNAAALARTTKRASGILLHGLRLLYFYGTFSILIPSLFALLFEAYLLIPLHTYLSRNYQPAPPHTIHFISDWTLGVLFVKVAARLILYHRNSRPAQALRALVSERNNGASWLDPDIKLATRAFILPITILMCAALLAPLGLGRIANTLWFSQAPEEMEAVVYRYAFPSVLFLGLSYAFGRAVWRALLLWRAKVRDEVYLIGERLHNFGEKRPIVNRVISRG